MGPYKLDQAEGIVRRNLPNRQLFCNVIVDTTVLCIRNVYVVLCYVFRSTVFIMYTHKERVRICKRLRSPGIDSLAYLNV